MRAPGAQSTPWGVKTRPSSRLAPLTTGLAAKSRSAKLPAMNLPLPLQFFFLLLVGWVNRHQDDVIAYLKEENRVLREL